MQSKEKSTEIEPADLASVDSVSNHICKRIKELRSERHWSLETLSNASGVSRSMLSQIERNQANPTLAVTFRIAQAFGISLGEMVEMPRATSLISVIRADDRGQVYRSDKDVVIRTLSPLNLEKDVEFYEVQLQPGGCLRSAAHFEGTREFITVQKGLIHLESGGDSEDLQHGDSATYRADVPHALTNSSKMEALIFLVDIYR